MRNGTISPKFEDSLRAGLLGFLGYERSSVMLLSSIWILLSSTYLSKLSAISAMTITPLLGAGPVSLLAFWGAILGDLALIAHCTASMFCIQRSGGNHDTCPLSSEFSIVNNFPSSMCSNFFCGRIFCIPVGHLSTSCTILNCNQKDQTLNVT